MPGRRFASAGAPTRRPAGAAALHALQPHAQPELRGPARPLRVLEAALRTRLQTDGICFICPGVKLEIGRNATLRIGRWAWIGHRCKIRVHEGEVSIGAKTVIGQECTISAFQHVSIGRECIVADRVMLIDFDHGAPRSSALSAFRASTSATYASQTTSGSATARASCGASPSATTPSSAPARCSPSRCPRTPSSRAPPLV